MSASATYLLVFLSFGTAGEITFEPYDGDRDYATCVRQRLEQIAAYRKRGFDVRANIHCIEKPRIPMPPFPSVKED